MPRRSLFVPTAVLLFAGLAALPACNKNKPDGGGGDPPPGPSDPPAAVSSEYLLFARRDAKQIRESALFAEVKKAFEKAGGMAEWDEVEKEVVKEIGGVKPTEIDSVTVCVPEFPPEGEPKFILIVTANKPIDKAAVFKLGQAKPDARGLYTISRQANAHFPDAKTLVVLHPDLAQKYLGGYAKDRAGWPMTAELTKAAAGHTLFAAVQLTKLPGELFGAPGLKEFAPLLSAKSVTLTADLKGKEVGVAARAAFPDAAAAGKARDAVRKFIDLALGEIDNLTGKGKTDLGAFMPAITEAKRALKEAKVEVSGSDLTVAGSYNVNFDIGSAVTDAVKKVREAAARMKAQNNLKQIGIALHSFADTNNGSLPVHGVKANGVPLQNPKDKPLLSWRVTLLPYVEQEALYKQFKLDEPWDSEHNKKLIEKMPKLYEPVGKPTKPGYTHTQMVIGPNALQPAGMRFPASFPDGTSNTIAVVEAAEPVIWTKPDDVTLTGKELPKDFRKKFGGLFPGRVQRPAVGRLVPVRLRQGERPDARPGARPAGRPAARGRLVTGPPDA